MRTLHNRELGGHQQRLTWPVIGLLALLMVASFFAIESGQTSARTPERYIVVLNEGVPAAAVAGDHALTPELVYEHALNGFSTVVPPGRLNGLQRDPRVAYVEPDQIATVNQTVPWGISRVGAGSGSGNISNVHVYIIDTGADVDHADLNVVNHVNFATGPNKDCHGHGTHVAGTVAAIDNTIDVVGVAPGAPITGVKVLSCAGSGSYSGVIAGVDWVTANAQQPAIANMSLGGGASQALDDAVKNSADSGVFYSIAAGNSGANACNYSPARAGTHNGVMTVAATNSNDDEASWSNYGNCVDIWAPGVSILSTKSGGGTTTMSGTSMAAPHAGGAGAFYLAVNTGASAATVEAALKANADSTTKTSKDGRTIEIVHIGAFLGDVDSAPTVTITSPSDGATVDGIVTITADAVDDEGVTQVEFFVDGGSVGVDSDGTNGWSTDWNSTSVADGDHTITATATDTAGQTGSDSIHVTVDNVDDPPSVTITNPNNGATVSGAVTITAEASDDRGVTQVEFFVNGSSVGVDSDGTNGWSTDWNSASVADGDHTITATATDTAGQTTTSDTVTVTVDNSGGGVGVATYTASLSSQSINAAGPNWTARVTVTISSSTQSVSGILVTAHWDDGTDASCTTDSSGTCVVDKSSHMSVSSVTYTIDYIAGSSDIDGGTSITVLKP